MEESFNRTQARLLAVEKSNSQVQDDLSSMQRLVGTHSHLLLTEKVPSQNGPSVDKELDQRIPAIETKVDELEKGLQETRKGASSIRKYLRSREREVPILEGKVERLEELVNEVRLSLDTVGGRVAGLGSRVTTIEANTGTFAGASGMGGDPENRNSEPGGSPAVYPSRRFDHELGINA